MSSTLPGTSQWVSGRAKLKPRLVLKAHTPFMPYGSPADSNAANTNHCLVKGPVEDTKISKLHKGFL